MISQLTITKQAKEMRLTIEIIDESNATVHSSVRIADEESLESIREELHICAARMGETEYDLAIEAADHHVVDEAAGKAVQRPVLFIVGRTCDRNDRALDGDFHIRMDDA